MKRTPLAVRILQALKEGKKTLKEISHHAKSDESTVSKVLKELRRDGLVVRVGWGTYALSDVVAGSWTEVISAIEEERARVAKIIEEARSQNSFLERERSIDETPWGGRDGKEEKK